MIRIKNGIQRFNKKSEQIQKKNKAVRVKVNKPRKRKKRAVNRKRSSTGLRAVQIKQLGRMKKMKARISINSINAPKQQQGGFNYTLGIGYVNRADLLRQALDSIPMLWPNTFVVDNSEHRELQNHAEINGIVPIINPSVPLSFSQTMNLLQKEALNQGCEVLLFMHNDAIAHEGTPDRLLELIRSLQQEGRKWGAVFTHYDVLVAFNMKAVQEVGSWDTNLPQYFSDNDYYRRMRLAGYEMIESGLPVTHQNGSSTLHADPYRNMVNGILFPLHAQYYGKKWDGEPGSEQYSIPFNRTF